VADGGHEVVLGAVDLGEPLDQLTLAVERGSGEGLLPALVGDVLRDADVADRLPWS
jgi:hypothetical protein